MKKILGWFLVGGGITAGLGLLLCVAPAVLLWAVNSLAAAGGLVFYIPHTFWNYWVALWFIICVRGIK